MHHVVAICVALCGPAANYEPDFVALFKPLEYRYTGGGYRDELFLYRLYSPETTGPTDKKPLIVWLNGHGEAGRDNILQLRYLSQLMFRPPHVRARFPFFMLAVQSPPENPDWTATDGASTGDDMINVVHSILEQTIRDNPVDPDRIYLAGISSGGGGCWEFAIRHPTVFAAVAPISSAGSQRPELAKLRDTPIWAFNCSSDASTPIERVSQTIESLRSAGGVVHLTEVDSKSHDAWTAAFEEYHLLDWLLSQRRGRPSPAPGTIPLTTRLQDFAKGWQWWQALAQVAIPGLILVAIWKALQRHGRRPNARSASPAAIIEK
jgi:pimeloyl-ACP methyl ester carboxylesterase